MKLEYAVPSGFVYNSTYHVLHGTIRGYLVLIYPMESAGQYRILLQLDVEQSTRKEMFAKYLTSLELKYPFVYYAGYNGKNRAVIQMSGQEEQDKENLEKILDEITQECERYKLHTCCEECGKKGEVYPLAVDGIGHVLCESCAAQLVGGGDAHGEERMLRGFVGAVTGAAVGSLVWLLLGQLGYTAGFAGYGIVFCSIRGYAMLGKTMSKAGVIISIVTSVLLMIGMEFFSLGVTIYRQFHAEYVISLAEALRAVPGLLMSENISRGVLIDLLVGFTLAALAGFFYVKRNWCGTEEKGAVHTVNRL